MGILQDKVHRAQQVVYRELGMDIRFPKSVQCIQYIACLLSEYCIILWSARYHHMLFGSVRPSSSDLFDLRTSW